jgi:hypothetical protein
MNTIILLLDLDGVLITTPPWKADKMDSDGYSSFNNSCVDNMNKLLKTSSFEIWLSSSRRKHKSLEEFNTIFSNRGIMQSIHGFLPKYEYCKNRKEELEQFLSEREIVNYLIIDDDKSLHSLDNKFDGKVIHTLLQTGFNEEKLNEALKMLLIK